MNKEQQLRLLHHCRWLLVVLCLCCCCTAKHGTAIAFTNAAIASTRGGANTVIPAAPATYANEIRYATVSTQHAAATSEAPSKSKSSDSSSDNTPSSSSHQDDPSKVRASLSTLTHIDICDPYILLTILALIKHQQYYR